MANLNVLFVPLLFGLILSETICRAGILWQKERTWRMFAFFMVFFCFCLLYLIAALALPTMWRDAARTLLLLALGFGNWIEWVELIDFLRKKNAKFDAKNGAAAVEVKTLKALADEIAPATLEATKATEKESTVDAA